MIMARFINNLPNCRLVGSSYCGIQLCFFVLLLDRIASTGLFVVVLSQYLALIHRTFFK